MTRTAIRALSFAAAMIGGVVACGGNGSSPPPGSSGAVASGMLVDHESGLPLSGQRVALAPWNAGAGAVAQGTTAAEGTFKVSAPTAGEYLLVIGSDSANDTTRPTIHDAVYLTGGSQTLVAPTMPPVPTETPNPVESSGKFRLTTLTAAESACLTQENSVRAQHGYAPVVSDEWLTENNRMNWQRTEATGQYGGGPILTNYNAAYGGQTTCRTLIDDDFSVPGDPLSANAMNWYAGVAGGSPNASAQELGMFDPRGVLPQPTPGAAWP
jgi:hypothetical protein